MTQNPADNARKALTDSLNRLLADCFALYLKTKNFHWHVRGPNFRDLHLLFDEQAAAIFVLTDLVAERVRKNGASTLTSIGAIAEQSRIVDQNDASLSADAMIAELAQDNRTLVEAFREVKEAASVAGDNATDGLLDDWTDQAEQRAWFLEQTIG